MKKDAWRDYFIFSKKERVAIIILFFIMAVFIVLPYFYSADKQTPVIDDKLKQQIAQLETGNENPKLNAENDSENLSQQSYTASSAKQSSKISLFYFDPNTLDQQGWKQLGLSDKTINTIINYRSKGGHFQKAEDIRKIYGIQQQDADRLIPYIQIKTDTRHQNVYKKDTTVLIKAPLIYTKKISTIDINTATAEEWKALPGIGDVLSNRIVKFRTKCGGFTSIDDLKKTYGLQDSTFQMIREYLTITSPTPQK